MRQNCPHISLRNSVDFRLALDAHKFSKDTCGKIVQISVRNFVELGVASDATNSVRVQEEKLCTNFSKASCRILTSFRCAQVQ